MVRQFQDYDKTLQSIKELVRQTVEQNLGSQRHVLILAFLSVVESCRRDPVKFNILYCNLSTAAIIQMRLAGFDQTDECTYGLYKYHQSCYQNEDANNVEYYEFLVAEAEKFFYEIVKELQERCIDQLTGIFTLPSILSQLTRR
jgi:hypothetical protein